MSLTKARWTSWSQAWFEVDLPSNCEKCYMLAPHDILNCLITLDSLGVARYTLYVQNLTRALNIRKLIIYCNSISDDCKIWLAIPIIRSGSEGPFEHFL